MTTRGTASPTIRFTAVPEVIGETTLVRLPPEASARLPTRGQVARGSRSAITRSRQCWSPTAAGATGCASMTAWPGGRARPGDPMDITVELAEDWPEPEVPQDLSDALGAAPAKIQGIWEHITPMARWEWVRWVGATRNAETRQRRVEVSIDKLDHGKRRPCCFDLTSCTDPDVSRSGKLGEPS